MNQEPGQKDFLPQNTQGQTNLLGVTHAEGRARAENRLAEREKWIAENLPKSAQRVFESAPVKYKKLLAKVLCGEANRTEAVKAHCQQCVGWEDTIRRVRDCGSRACAVWHHRPYQAEESETEDLQ